MSSPTPVALLAVAGTALQLQQPQLWAWWVYAGLLGSAVLVGVTCCIPWRWNAQKQCARTDLYGRWRLWGSALVLGFAWAGWQATVRDAERIDPALEGVDIEITATVQAMPTRTAQGVRMLLKPQTAHADGQAVQLPSQLLVTWYAPREDARSADRRDVAITSVPQVQAGDVWRWVVRLKAPHGVRNPHGWDWELWLWEQNIGATGYVRTGRKLQEPERLAQAGWRFSVERIRQHVRDAIVQQGEAAARRVSNAPLFKNAEQVQRAYGVVAALVTGDQRAIDAQDWDVFRRTGVAHLVSISGLHITLFAWLATRCVGLIWKRSARWNRMWPAPFAAPWMGLALAAAYALFSGWGVPAQRTIGMLAMVVVLRTGGWRWPASSIWSLALACIALADPWALLQPGFWLSFVAVGVLIASGDQAPAPRGWRSSAHQLLREQMVLVLALSPLTLAFFGQISVVGAAANLLAIPWVTLLVTPLALLGVCWHGLWWAAALCVQAMVWWLETMSAWSWASLQLPHPPAWAMAFAIAAGVVMALRLPWLWKCMVLPWLLPALLWQPLRPAQGELEVLVLDVGQGSAVLLRTRDQTVLYDTGPAWEGGDAGERTVVPLLHALGEQPDVVVISHGDRDHAGGAAAVLQAFPEAQVWVGEQRALQDVPATLASGARECKAGMHWKSDGVQWQFLHPQANSPVQGNAASCVLQVRTSSDAVVLLPGDIEAAQEAAMVAADMDLRADLLVAPHHGSRSSSSAAFVEAVRPAVVVAQAGYRNRFQHPSESVVGRYRRMGAKWMESPQCGAVH